MSFMDNFTRFDGRIGRQSWWMGTILLIVISIVVWLIASIVVGGSMFGSIASAIPNVTPGTELTQEQRDAAIAAAGVSAAGAAVTLGWISLVLWLVLAYPALALGVKRRHDMNNNGYDAMIYFALQVVQNLLTIMGQGSGTISFILWWVMLIYSIYLLVVLGFLRGTVGPNQYGPDPLGGVAATA